MILMSHWASFGADISQISPKNCEQFGRSYGAIEHWKNAGFPTVIYLLMAMIEHGAYKWKHSHKYIILL